MKTDLYETLKKLARPLITFGVIIILSIMASATICVTLGANDIKTWIKFCVGFLLQLTMILLWLPEGKERGKKNDAYRQNKELANKKISEISTPRYFSALDKFCEYAYMQNLRNYVASRVDSRQVDYKRYLQDKEYAAKLDVKVKDKIWKLEKKAVKKVRAIKSTEITSNSSIDLVYDVWNHTKNKERMSILFKIIPTFVMAFVGASISFLMEPFSWSTVALLIYWIVTIGTTIVFSIKTGYDLVTISENDYALRMIDFIERFDGWILENGIEIKHTQTVTSEEKAPE